MIRLGILVVLVAILSGCSSHTASLYKIDGNETFIGWNNQNKLPSNSYYVLLEGDAEGMNWKVKEIYDHPIKGRSNELQEILFVDKNFAYVQPYFEINESTVVKFGETRRAEHVGWSNDGKIVVDLHSSANYMDRGSWECGNFFQANKDKYTSCSSRLTKTDVGRSIGKNIFAVVLTLGLMSGTHQVVDKAKIVEIIEQTHLFEKIKKSNVYASRVSAQ